MAGSRHGAVRPVPEHLHTVTPRLVVADGAAAIAFYAKAFGAQQIGERFTGPDGELIHAEIRIGNSVVMVTEDAAGPAAAPAASRSAQGRTLTPVPSASSPLSWRQAGR